MVYWNRNIITSNYFHIKFFTLDYFVFSIFLHIVGLFSIIYFHIDEYKYWINVCKIQYYRSFEHLSLSLIQILVE